MESVHVTMRLAVGVGGAVDLKLEFGQRPRGCQIANPVDGGFSEPEVPVRPHGDDVGADVAQVTRERVFGDGSGRRNAADFACEDLHEPDVPIRAGRDAVGLDVKVTGRCADGTG